MCKYSNHHTKINDDDAAHCATYALGGICDHEHVGYVESCTRLANFFDTPFASFINAIVMKQINDDKIWPEINTMIHALSRFNIMDKHYTVHRVRAMVHFIIIYKTKNDWLKRLNTGL